MPATYAQRLDAVRTAIDELVAGGQSVTYGGRTLSMADLDTLMKLEESYASKAAQELLPEEQRGRARVIRITPVDC